MTSAGNETEYAVWVDEATSFKIQYSLPVFHEIDFQVNEGYRRIPHGGVEIGGILYGKSDKNAVSVEAFRPIECEHATGPSFNLSPRDLLQLTASLATTPSDDELKGLVPIGWFIAHTRSPLRMAERESQLFNQFFPETGAITLLVKPERFQPTRFGFIVRGADKSFKTDVSNSAIILPLPGRAGSSSKGLVPSIPAPAIKTTPQGSKPAEPVQKVEAKPARQENPTVQRESLPDVKPPAKPVEPPPLVLPSVEEIRKRRSEHVRNALLQEKQVPEEAATRPLSNLRRPSHGRLLLALMLAALLGCGVGYWAYLQLPPAEINLRVHKSGPILLVQWAPEQTQNAGYAVLRINNGSALPLTFQQKASGRMEVKQTSDDMKIELIAQHWVRDSRGIVRFISLRP
ncbi:MAG: hypothetical protein JO182_05350 [Acidobacteriaceae bacterium]|nr:hypothetical protein [Acidobacteriaceae bacterium]